MTSRPAPAPRSTAASGSRRTLFNHHLSRRPTASSTSGTSATILRAATDDSNGDIVARDEHGNYDFAEPPITPMPHEDDWEDREIENRLLDSYKNHQHHVEPNELKATLQASLQAKVASLEEDKWMFEGEDGVQS